MNADRERIDARLERIELTCRRLVETARRPLEEYLGNDDLQAATERRLMLAVQAALDVGSHIIASEGWKTPLGYAEVFGELAARDVIEPELGKRLQMAAGLRNLLVHDYLDIDPVRIHDSLAEDVADLLAFAASVLHWLGTP